MEERLHKFMARCGVDSRRKCEELIAAGMVAVNGEVVREPGVRIDPSQDRVVVDGVPLRQEAPVYYMHYKVKGVTTTVSDELGRKTVMDCLPDIAQRVFPVGRLDRESEGLLVLTNDGEMANYITHPAHGIEKTYRVVAEGRVEPEVLEQLARKGMRLGPVLVRPRKVELVRHNPDSTVVLISVAEGVNREVRRIFAALGHEVKKLLRIQVGPLKLDKLKRGATRPLTAREVALLRAGMEGREVQREAEDYPPGSAKDRRPTGPRGRPHARGPRQGKPDPKRNLRREKEERRESARKEWAAGVQAQAEQRQRAARPQKRPVRHPLAAAPAAAKRRGVKGGKHE